MIRTVIVDDETDSRSVLQRLLETYCPQVTVIGAASGVDTALPLIREMNPDLVFLDIEMIHGNGFDLLNELQPIAFQVIFVTAFDEYAVKAFKYSAVDYLLKPVDIEDLQSAVEKTAARIQGKVDLSPIRTLLQNVGVIQLSQQKMAIPTINGLSFIPINDIIRFEAQGNYTAIFLTNGQTLMATRNIKEYELLLPEAIFCRIHNSHIINMQKIQKYQKGRGGQVIMEDGTAIEVAIRRRQDFLQRIVK
ncbi:MAG TPA: LytTR family DNA-binding domain-containing protein [Puia sp.]|nr:LytTR family DNA-binding domain-containing protein [Puia sp.]